MGQTVKSHVPRDLLQVSDTLRYALDIDIARSALIHSHTPEDMVFDCINLLEGKLVCRLVQEKAISETETTILVDLANDIIPKYQHSDYSAAISNMIRLIREWSRGAAIPAIALMPKDKYTEVFKEIGQSRVYILGVRVLYSDKVKDQVIMACKSNFSLAKNELIYTAEITT